MSPSQRRLMHPIGARFEKLKAERRARITPEDIQRIEHWRAMTKRQRWEWKARTLRWSQAVARGATVEQIAEHEKLLPTDVAFELEALARGDRKRWTWNSPPPISDSWK